MGALEGSVRSPWMKYSACVVCLFVLECNAWVPAGIAFRPLQSQLGLLGRRQPLSRNGLGNEIVARKNVRCCQQQSSQEDSLFTFSYEDMLSFDDIDDDAPELSPAELQSYKKVVPGPDTDFDAGIAAVVSGNSRPFFRYFAVDLLSSCGYMPMVEMPCTMEKCEITPADDVSPDLRKRDESEHSFQLDGWVRWDMPGDFTEYYDLLKDQERYTEYQGQRIWQFIHERICFQLRLDDPDNAWKNDFNRFISGMHSSVSVHVVEGMPADMQLQEYRRRLRDIPGAVSNLHFGFMLLLCAIHQATPRLTQCGYMGDAAAVLPSMKGLCFDPLLTDPAIQRAASVMRKHAQSPKARIWKARLRTRDLLMIMNCVQCNLCRLHGKVTALGVATCLQVMIGAEGRGGGVTQLHRIEVASLITVAAKFSHAIDQLRKWEALDAQYSVTA